MNLRLILVLWAFLSWGPVAHAQNTAAALPAPAAPADEVTLEANVVEIILNDEHRSGVDWAAIVSDFHTELLQKENDPVWNDKKNRLSFGTISQDDYSVLLDALDMAGQITQSPQNPVQVIAGKPASITFEKQKIGMNFLLARSKTGDLSLHIVPRITVPATEIFNGEKIPASVILKTETDIPIVNNMTIVTGGLIKEEVLTRNHKFPLLGNLPIVDLVFHYQGHLMQKTETVIFLTVRTNAVDNSTDNAADNAT